MQPNARARVAWTLLAAIAGTALLVWQVRDVGTAQIQRGFAAVGGWGATTILLLTLLRFIARSTGWTALLATDTPPGRALAAFIAGDAAGNLTPFALLASEPTKAAVLGWAVPTIGTAAALAALAAETFFFAVSVAIYVIAGIGVLLLSYEVDPPLRVAGLITLGAMTISLIVATWMALRQPTLAGSLLSRVPIAGFRTLGEHVRAFERTAYASTKHPGARVSVVIACTIVFHLLSYLELWLTLWLVTGESLFVAAFLLDSVGRVVNVFFKVIPMQLGVLQVGFELVARAIGLAPGVGVLVSLVRTVRVLVTSAVGVLIWMRLARRSVT